MNADTEVNYLRINIFVNSQRIRWVY